MSEVKFGELLGVELTKGLYQQLPHHKDHICFDFNDSSEGFHWKPELTIQGKINWCPPKCKEIDGYDHQHLFLMVNGSPCQGFTYINFSEGVGFPLRYEEARNAVNSWLEEALAKVPLLLLRF